MASNRNNRGIAAYIAVAAVLILAFVFIFPQITESGKKTQYSDVIKYLTITRLALTPLIWDQASLNLQLKGKRSPVSIQFLM